MRILQSAWFRIALALLLIAGLVAFNRINVDSFATLGARWPWLVAAFLWMLPTYLLVSYRFMIVLDNQQVRVPFPLALRWTMIGSFFDLVMPSNSGGDVIKCAYVVRHVGPGWRTRGVMAVAFDRILGLIGLFLLGSIAITLGWSIVRGLPGGSHLLLILPLVTLGSLAFFRIAGSRRLYNSVRFESALQRLPGGPLIHGVVGSFNSLRERPGQFFGVLALSVINHGFWCASLFCITHAFGLSVDLLGGLAVFPLAIFGNVFGFAGGFGVGTAAFDLVFSVLLHSSLGASVGLTFQLLSALTRLAGIPFYIHNPRPPADAPA